MRGQRQKLKPLLSKQKMEKVDVTTQNTNNPFLSSRPISAQGKQPSKCCRLDLKCCPEMPRVRCSVLDGDTPGSWKDRSRDGALGRRLGHCGVPFSGTLASWPLLFFLASCCPPVSSFAPPYGSARMSCLTTGPKQHSQLTMDGYPWSCEPKETFPPFRLILSGILMYPKLRNQQFGKLTDIATLKGSVLFKWTKELNHCWSVKIRYFWY